MINMCKSMSKSPPKKKLRGVEWVMGSVYNGFIFNDHPHKIISHKIDSFYVKVVLYLLGPSTRFHALSQSAFTCSKSTMKIPEQYVRSVQN